MANTERFEIDHLCPLPPDDSSASTLTEEELILLSPEERFANLYQTIITERVKPDEIPSHELVEGEDYSLYVKKLSDQMGASKVFQFYLGQDVMPLEDEGNVYKKISQLFRQHIETSSTIPQNLHLEAYVRFRQQGYDVNTYFDVLEALGDDVIDEIFQGSPSEPHTINYNRNLVTSNLISA